MATYAVADIHGQLNTFLAGLKAIDFSPADSLYVIGDAIDRGPDGIKLLEMIKAESNMDLIIGNHELMMLNSVDPKGDKKCDGEDAELWLYYNGGDATYNQYKKLLKAKRTSILRWLNNRYVMKTLEIAGKKFCLTHSYYKQGLEDKKFNTMCHQDIWSIVWTSIYRDDFKTKGINIYGDYDYTFITGHVPVQRVRKWFEVEEDYDRLESHKKGNLIDIDGGCSMGYQDDLNNGLIFLRLDDMKEFPIHILGE